MKMTKVEFFRKEKEKLGRQCPGSWFDQPSNVEYEEKTPNETQTYISSAYFPIAIAR